MAFTSGMTAFRRIAPLAALGSLALALTGCTLGTIATSGSSVSAAHVSGLGGKIMGGEQPIAGATVAMYTVGTTGYGTGAAAIPGATTTTDQYGNFQIPNFTCPVSNSVGATGTDPLTYIVATGGNPGLGLAATVTGETVTGSSGAYTDTFTGANNFYVGESVVFSGFTTFSYLNGTQTITAVTGNQGGNSTFSVADTSASNPGAAAYTDTGLVSGQSSTNAAIKLVAPTGTCSTSGSVNLNLDEVATAATAYALAQYTAPATGQIGAPNTVQAQTGLINALGVLPLLVNSAGQPVTSTPLTGAGFTLTAAPEATKLATVANVLAACVNSNGSTGTGSACGTLFSNAGAGTATDTFDAAVEMAQQPYNTAAKVSALYGLQTPQSPFGGTSTLPTDWTLGIQYQDNVGTFFLKPQNLAVDASGNVWVLSNASGAGGLVEVTPNGTPQTTVSGLSEYGPFSSPIATPPVLSSPKTTTTALTTQNYVVTTTFGSSSNNQPGGLNPRNLAIDPSGNVFFTESSGVSSSNGGSAGSTTVPISGNIFEYATNGQTYGFATGKSAYGVAIDTTGNVFVGDQSTSSYFSLFEFPSNTTPGNGLLQPAGFPANGTSGSEIGPEYLAIDTNGNKWFTNGTTAAYKATGVTASACTNTAASPSLCQPTGAAYTALTGFSSTSAPYGIAAGSTIWIANTGTGTGGNTLTSIGLTSTSGTAYGSSQTLNGPKYPALDGSGNVWVGNSSTDQTSTSNTTAYTSGGSISALTSAGTFLSPSNGGSTTVAPGFTHPGIIHGYGTAVDPSGNVWVANYQAFTAACPAPVTPATNTCSSIFEIVGSATPVVTPIASYATSGPTRP